MNTRLFLENPAYVEYVRQLLKLQALMAQGLGESSEADALREEITLIPYGCTNIRITALPSISRSLFCWL